MYDLDCLGTIGEYPIMPITHANLYLVKLLQESGSLFKNINVDLC